MDLTGNRKRFSFLVYFFSRSASTTSDVFMSEFFFLGNCMWGLTRAAHEITANSYSHFCKILKKK